MDRRNALMTVGGAAVSTLAGCTAIGGSEDDSGSAAPPVFEGILVWSILEDGESRRARITVDKDGTQRLETRHEFEGESRFVLVEDWMGDPVPYSITLEMDGPEAARTYGSDVERTYSSSDVGERHDCWHLQGEIHCSSTLLAPAVGERDCEPLNFDDLQRPSNESGTD